MLFGLGLGLVVALGVYVRAPAGARAPEPSAAAPAPRQRDAASSARTQPKSDPAPETSGNRFGFYEILPQLEVVVPDDAPTRTAARARPAEAPGSYLLQAGSFSAAADADRLQANLALLGFESHVQRVKLEDAVFNRVRIGPIGDLDTAKRTQRRLRDAGIDSLLMQVPK
jgi:cell division protein FtsN